MNSVLIHTLRQRLKLKMSEKQDQSQKMGHNSKNKNSDRQIFTMLLLVTFGYLILNIPVKSLIFYLNFYSGHTTYYYASLHLFYRIGGKTLYTNHGINFFLYFMSGQKFRTDLKNLFICNKNSNSERAIRVISFIGD